MPRVDLVVKTPVSRSVRSRQLEGMFDVPPAEESVVEWHAELPLDEREWSVGAIVGPSGAGKSSVAREVFGASKVDRRLRWGGASVLDDFDESLSMEQIAEVCSAVGFNTIPAWRRPFKVLSNGEQFRVSLARHLLEDESPIVVDEFTSVVDRQVGKIAAHAVQKYVRRHKKQFVAVSCHDDIIDWLQPDWVFEPHTAKFAWRSLQRRPEIECVVSPVPRPTWAVFAPYHYLTGALPKNAACFGLFVGGRIAAFAGMIRAVTSNAKGGIVQCSRLVTLPDYQGLGLAFVLIDAVGSIYKSLGEHVHTYPAHPALIRAFDRSPRWALRSKPVAFKGAGTVDRAVSARRRGKGWERTTKQGSRPNAVFRYVGPALDRREAARVLLFFADTEGRHLGHDLL